MRILIVDDSRAMRMIVSRTLRQAGYGHHEFVEAGNGVEALAVLAKGPVDLILSDWNMPEMAGIDLLRHLTEQKSEIPFGFVTSEGTGEMRGLASQTGALFLITKPFTADVFKQELSPILG